MESNHKQRGFIKAKLAIPIYKTAKSVSTAPYISKVTPDHSSALPTAAATGYYTVHQDYLAPHQPKQSLSFVVPDYGVESMPVVHYDKIFGTASDEAIDLKAANYISSVQERLKLERVNSKRIKYEDVLY